MIEARLGISALFAALLLACSGPDDDRPPPNPGCTDDCNGPGNGSGSGDGGTGNGMGGAPAATNDVTGVVVAVNDASFLQTSAFTDFATVFAESPTVTNGVSGVYDGVSFELDNVLSDGQAWVAVRPDDIAAFVDTFSYPDLTQASVEAPVVSRLVLEQTFLSLASPAEVDVNSAQLVIRVFQADGTGVPGVTINTTAGDFVAYSSSGVFSDTETVTDSQGLIIVGNIAATRFPGSDFVIRLGGAAKLETSARIARGFVTLLGVVVVP